MTQAGSSSPAPKRCAISIPVDNKKDKNSDCVNQKDKMNYTGVR